MMFPWSWWGALFERVEPVCDDARFAQARSLHELERRMREQDRRPWQRPPAPDGRCGPCDGAGLP